MTLEKLKACRCIRFELESLDEHLTRLRCAMERMTMVIKRDGGVGNPIHDKLGAQMAELDEQEREYRLKVLECGRLMKEIEDWLNRLPPNQRIVMRLRYVDGLSWRQIERRAKFCRRQCFRFHEQAQKKLSPNVTS